MAIKLEERIRIKRTQQAELIPSKWRINVPAVAETPNAIEYIKGLLSSKELEITQTADANVLLQKLAQKELSAVEVLTAFCKRAAFAHQLTNCCTEIFFEDALAAAKSLDDHLEKGGSPVGHLHGLPVSVKDMFDVKGVDTSIGWVGLTEQPAKEDGVPVQVLRQLGAIPFVKTNIPQSMMMSDSYNHVFGQCVHPMNRNLISGGSSGGEASLVGAGGSILGIGSDIGGSIRIPASLCGLYGLNPTQGRQPWQSKAGRQDIVRPVAGPLASSLATIDTYMKHLTSLGISEPWSVPVPWRPHNVEKLKIGYVIDDGIVKVQPPAARAVKEVVELLRSAGHEVFEWDANSHGYCYELWEKGILSDGGEACRKLCELSGESLIEGMLVGTDKNILTTSELHKLNGDKYAYEAAYLKRWNESGIDALIMPVTPWIGYPPWTWVKSHQYVGYTSIWNFLNYAALSIPWTTATEDELDQAWLAHVPRNKSDEFNHKQYDPKLVKGMPVGVQIVGGKFGDEKTISVARIIEQLRSG